LSGRVVVKFGGADLSTPANVKKAARMVLELPYEERVVVVSAMGKMTDELVSLTAQLGEVDDSCYAEIVSIGERLSARVLCTSLKTQGAKAEFIDPADSSWPIITDSSFRNAKVDFELTKRMVQDFLVPRLKRSIVVVCGFLGKNSDGKITTLGRGGSDTTALLLGNCLEAEEVILVKETNGILSADPKSVPSACPINKMDIHEMFDLAYGGARVIKPEALKYKLPDQKLRIVSFNSNKLAEGGTEIVGSFNANSAELFSHEGLSAINVICEVNASNLQRVLAILNGKPVYGVSSGKNSVTVFTVKSEIIEVINELHNMNGVKALSFKEGVAMIQAVHPSFIDLSGAVSKISAALYEAGINILEVTTSKATVNVFIEENKLRSAMEAIGEVL
jgi:aspartate kinase